MNDSKELLLLAAKAAGVVHPEILAKHLASGWNPLEDDGDALRLAVKLRLLITNRDDLADAYSRMYADKTLPSDPYAAIRRTIVLAAAEIGKELP